MVKEALTINPYIVLTMGCRKLSYYQSGKGQAKKKTPSFLKTVWRKNESSRRDVNYSPFGSPMPQRSFNQAGYRYGFQGKEIDNEIRGNGNSVNYDVRIYDPRLGRFLSQDPQFRRYAFLSPYSMAGNNPIQFVDNRGEHPHDVIDKSLEDLGVQWGYSIVFDKTTETAVIVKSEVTYDAGNAGKLDENVVVYTLRQTVIRLNEFGEVNAVFISEREVSAEAQKSSGFFSSEGDLEFIRNKLSEPKRIASGTIDLDEDQLIPELEQDILVFATGRLLTSQTHPTAFHTGVGLPNLAFDDAVDRLFANIVLGGITVITEGHLDFNEKAQADFNTFFETGRPSTTLNIPKDEVNDAAIRIIRVAGQSGTLRASE